MKKVVILASGSGTLARAIFAANKDYEIAALICDRPQAKVIEVANEFGVKVELLELTGDREFALRLPYLLVSVAGLLLFFLAAPRLTTAKIEAARRAAK